MFKRSKAQTRSSISIVFIFLVLISYPAPAQRTSTYNSIGWYNSLNTVYLNKKVSLWVEYQWRREAYIENWQQSLLRTGIQYHFPYSISALAGYAYVITYPYGDYPAGPHPFPEHRIFEQLIWNGAIGRIGLNHRLRLEQRFLGRVNQKDSEYQVNGWNYLNRVRYQLRTSIPLNHEKLQDKTWYAAAYDELFIGFGKNVNQNIFDQNRIGLLLGYQLNKTFRAEAGFLSQILQQAALVNGHEVIQYNNGLILNLYLIH